MEFARRGGLEPTNRYQRGAQNRRGSGRSTPRYESYFDRQGDVRLQDATPGGPEGFKDPRPANSQRSSYQHQQQHSAIGLSPEDRPFSQGFQPPMRGELSGRGGRGGFHRNPPNRGAHFQRGWNGREDHGGAPFGFQGPQAQAPGYPGPGMNHLSRPTGHSNAGINHSGSPASRPGIPGGYQGRFNYPGTSANHPNTPMVQVHSQVSHVAMQAPQPEDRYNNSIAQSKKIVSHGNKVTNSNGSKPVVTQVLKREPQREPLKEEKHVEKSKTENEGKKEDPQTKEPPDVKQSQTTTSREKEITSKTTLVETTQNSSSRASGHRQKRPANRKGSHGKGAKSVEQSQLPESDKRGKMKGNRDNTMKVNIPSKNRDSDKNQRSSQGAKAKTLDAPVSPEEFESLKVLEERLREVKLFGAEKYESKPKAAAQAIRSKQKVIAKYAPLDSEQAKNLVEQLIDGTYDCMVCCERIKFTSPVWSCSSCYHIFHLPCIKKWVDTSTATGKDPDGWRCPGCQNVNKKIPDKYKCFCGKVTNPEWKAKDGITPHSCGNVCKKSRMVSHCSHLCTELCHPGPCPSCPVMIPWHCPCGKKSYQIRCGQAVSRPCGNTCDKTLKCGRHKCEEKCHLGPCNHCVQTINLACFCGKKTTEEICGSEQLKQLKMLTLEDEKGAYSCDENCGRTLGCGNHHCSEKCHPGPCKECSLLPKNVTHCPCGKVELKELLGNEKTRETCLDPIPCCESICQKLLKCGSDGKPHYCKKTCHLGPCGPCDGTSVVSCRCGSNKKEAPCAGDIKDREFQCGKICKKKRTCGRHRCNTKCCVDDTHICVLVCGKKLQCGIHHCDELCHPGYCPRCWQTGFEERTCRCGKTVQEPPIPCGTPLPDCPHPCSRTHECDHPPQHTCHNNPSCTLCPVLTKKSCMGGHETRESIPCHVKDFSCGKKCGKPLSCGHTCDKPCHKGECLQNDTCPQPCMTPRKNCGHPCMAQCHADKECPNTACSAQVTVHCPCGRKSALTFCKADNVAKDNFSRFVSENIGDKMHVLQSGQLDINALKRKTDRLLCDEECAIVERNRRLAEAFNMEVEENRPTPRVVYSFFLQQEAEGNLAFVKTVEDTLEELVLKVKKLEQSQLSHSFPPMTSTQRRIIHELSAHYGCRTQSYDQEPRRNTIVMATKESRVPPNKLYAQFYQQGPPKPLVLVGDKAMDFQPFHLETLEKKPKRQSGPDYFDDHYKD